LFSCFFCLCPVNPSTLNSRASPATTIRMVRYCGLILNEKRQELRSSSGRNNFPFSSEQLKHYAINNQLFLSLRGQANMQHDGNQIQKVRRLQKARESKLSPESTASPNFYSAIKLPSISYRICCLSETSKKSYSRSA
jgi:hypothetical protein